MSEGWYITAHDINHWADKKPRRAQEELPLLVRRLISASVNPNNIHIPSGNAVLIKGWDGIVEIKEENPFVPLGVSVWEFGTAKDFRTKAKKDYETRCKNSLGVDKANAIFVIVTSRIWQNKNEWEKEKNAEGKWKQVKVLDAVDLETWLYQCPAVHRWFARRLGKRPEGAFDIEQAWDKWKFASNPPSNEDLAIAGRTNEAKNIIQKLRNTPSAIRVFGESKDEAYAFILASIFKYAKELIPRVLVIPDAREWISVIDSSNPLILVPMFDSPNPGLAVQKGHWVIVPESTPQNRNQKEDIVLPKPDKQSLIKALIEMGVKEEKAWHILKATRSFLMPIRRMLGNYKKPKWAKTDESLITALLIGAWDEQNEYDKEKVKKLAGMSYEQVERNLHTWSVEDDPPVRKVGRIWQVISRQDMWQQLAPYIDAQTLEKFGKIAVEILKEPDPRYELKPEERWLGNIKGKSFKHSNIIRKHVAEMLAMLSAYGDRDLKYIGEISIQDKVSLWIRNIFENASFNIWYSLRDLLPYLAEAAPEVFLEKVEEWLKSNAPLMELFKEEGVFGGCPHAGLLWALEGISWNIDYLPRVVLILAKLSRLDPGGSWANRPFSSLREIFLSWYPQTRASVDEKLQLLDLLLNKESETAWKLLLSLIPKHVGEISTPIHKPYFRDWTEGWKPKITQKDYRDYMFGISEKIREYGIKNLKNCLSDLIEILEYLPKPIFDSIIEALETAINNIPFEKNVKAYEKLFEIICKHKRLPDAKWALSKEAVEKLDILLQKITPDDIVSKNRLLFSKWPNDLICQPGIKYPEAEKIVEDRRKKALEEIWEKQGLNGIIQLIKLAKLSDTIGHSLAISSLSDKIEDTVFQWLDSEIKELNKVAKSFIFTKFNQDKNYLQAAFEKYKSKWDTNKWVEFYLSLPFTWDVIKFIQEFSPEIEKIYWQKIRSYYQFDGSKEQAEYVVRKLLDNGRSVAALNAAQQYLYTIAKESGLDAGLLAEVLEQVATNPEDSHGQMDFYGIEKIFEYLQQSSDIAPARLVRLEWLYVPYFWHNRYGVKVRPVTLIKEVLNNPSLFVQLIRWAFKADPPIEGEFSNLSLEQRKMFAENSYFLLDIINELPGQVGNSIDWNKLMDWITQVREGCAQVNHLPICDEKIGEILAHAPVGKDGIWPHEAVREVIERVESIYMERGIEIGIYSQRGIIIKSSDEGGKQERELAEKYRQFADKLKFKWPRTAAMLQRIADGYIGNARYEDIRRDLDELL